MSKTSYILTLKQRLLEGTNCTNCFALTGTDGYLQKETWTIMSLRLSTMHMDNLYFHYFQPHFHFFFQVGKVVEQKMISLGAEQSIFRLLLLHAS